ERGNPDNCAGLPYDEILSVGESGGLEIGVPVDTGSLGRKIGALPWIVLFEDVCGVFIGSKGAGDLSFEREDARRFASGIGNARELERRDDVGLVFGALIGHFRRGVEIIFAIGQTQTAL